MKKYTNWLLENNNLGDVTNYYVTIPGSNLINDREENGTDDLRCGFDRELKIDKIQPFFYMKHMEWVNKDMELEIKINKEQALNLINVLKKFINFQ